MTRLESMGESTILPILPFVAVLTHELMVFAADGPLKSSPSIVASKYCLSVCTNDGATSKPCRYQIAFAISKDTCGSRPRSREIRLSYDASASDSDIELKPSVDFIASNVLPSAPFMVMPSAIDALSGERNTFELASRRPLGEAARTRIRSIA